MYNNNMDQDNQKMPYPPSNNNVYQNSYPMTNQAPINPNPYANANAPPMGDPPPYNYNSSNDTSNVNLEQKFREIVNKYEISQFFSSKLQKLFSYKIVFVFDDSGSMNSVLNDSPLNTGLLKATRWDELQYFAKIAVEIANVFNQEGTDVYFLNRPMVRNVIDVDQLMPYFRNKPAGYTPLVRVLHSVLSNNNLAALNERNLLIIIVTDGEPTDDNGRVNIPEFRQILASRNNKTYSTIVSCTDEENTMDYLNDWDRNIPRLDIVDDYRSEKVEIKRAKGNHFSFTFGDYVVKSLIGSIDHELDIFDERHASSGCCNII